MLVVIYNITRRLYFIMLGKYLRWAYEQEKNMDDIISEQQEEIIYPSLLDQTYPIPQSKPNISIFENT